MIAAVKGQHAGSVEFEVVRRGGTMKRVSLRVPVPTEGTLVRKVSKRRKDGKQHDIPKVRPFPHLAGNRQPIIVVTRRNDVAGRRGPQSPAG